MLRKPHSRRRRQGFTLMEVLLVVAILIILASLATISITQAYRGTRKNAATLDINTMGTALQKFYIDIGNYPSDLAALDSAQGLPDESKWNGPYLQKGVPNDPWGNPYIYKLQGEDYVIYSAGPDGIENNEDDISSAK